MYQLRGHHIFCMVGYQGVGYSKEYADNMTAVHNKLQRQPQKLVQLISGPDMLCAKFPCYQENHCHEKRIYAQDAAILDFLGLQVGQIVSWATIEQRLKIYAKPNSIQTLCGHCTWRKFGYCEQGFKHLLDGHGLQDVKFSP